MRLLILALLLATTNCLADSESSGRNDLQPTHRLDLRYEYENLDPQQQKYTFRLNNKFTINQNWTSGLRVDLPVALIRKDDEGSSSETGLGKLLLQSIFIKRIEDFRWGAGLRVHTPAVSNDDLGDDKWDIAPMAGMSLDLPRLGHGSFTAFMLRHRFTLSRASDEIDTNQLEPILILNVHLKNNWFVDFRTEPILDFETDNRWSLPIGLTVGKVWQNNIIFSLEPEYYIIENEEGLNFALEARIGYFFNRIGFE